MNASVNSTLWSFGQVSPPHGSDSGSKSSSSFSVCLRRYLRWLRELHSTIDAVSDDAYTLDRLVRQGILPLRQRTGITPTLAEAQLRAAVCALLIGDAVAQPGRPGANMWAPSTAKAGSKYTPSSFKSTSPSPLIVHTETPPCPCRTYFERQQREAESRLLHHRESSQDDDDSKESHAGRAAVIDSGSSSSSNGEDKDRAVRLSATVSHFTARFKDAVRGVETVDGQADAPLVQTVTLGYSGGNPSSRRGASPFEGGTRASSRPSGGTPSQKVNLLPVAAASSFPASSTGSNDTTQQPQCDSRESSESSAPSPFRPLPVPVEADTQAHRTLHPMLAHVSPEDVRRCSLCSAQLLLESAWHSIYQMNLLTLLSGAPSMAAPLPLPPPDILRIHPTEALLLLYQCTQRYFVSGITMATSVGIPALLMKNGSASLGRDEGAQPHGALDVLRGDHAGGAATNTSLTGQQQQQQHTAEERVLAGLASSLLCVVGGITGTAAEQLWPRVTTTAPSKVMLSDIIGDVLAVRFKLFHTLFVLCTTENGSRAALAELRIACDDLLACLQRLASLHQKNCASDKASPHPFPLTQTSENHAHLPECGDVEMTKSKEAAGATTDASAAEKFSSPTPFDSHSLDAVHETIAQAFALLGTPRTTPCAVGAAIGDEAVAVVMDDIRALCCVAALLGLFARLVHTREVSACVGAGASTPASEPDSPTSPFLLSSSRSMSPLYNCPLLDYHVYPCLQRLQNSTRGDCSAQARHLVALWWLLRAEAVRHWVWATAGCSFHVPGRSAALKVLDVLITVHENPEHETQSVQEQQCQHWPQWLRDASRAAVRASDVANEFLGLTLIPAWSSASSSLSTQPPTTPGASMNEPLRWQLPAFSTPPLSLQKSVALLPLPWLRLWLLLCPPLFRASPADVFALRQQVQHQREREDAPPAIGRGSTAVNRGTAPGGAEKGGAVRKDKAPRQAPARSTSQVVSRAKLKPPKRTAVIATTSVVAKPHGGSHNRSESITSVTAAPYDKQAREAQLQHRLQHSKEPVCFWLRWCLLFTPSPRSQSKTIDSDALSSSSSTLLLSALERVVTALHYPRSAWIQGMRRSAASSTEIVLLLQHAFPIYTPANLVSALTAQAQLFLACGEDLRNESEAKHQAAATLPPAHKTSEDITFAPYSFAAAVRALHDAVEDVKHSSATPTPTPPH
ncbi:hypothetical protein JKF63_01087 [Porcisia hertigi]|uniref:Uncharacterized protein n=1 Tax=Porcisia hertigi TaxID=2761500 RepID=A0A836HH12_9TRYP|nr:hypothetical protein JKF63_01087 [Porcisia hertigi]